MKSVVAYVVWGGVGAAITVLYAFAFGGEPVTTVKICLLIGLLCCISGLKLISEV